MGATELRRWATADTLAQIDSGMQAVPARPESLHQYMEEKHGEEEHDSWRQRRRGGVGVAHSTHRTHS